MIIKIEKYRGYEITFDTDNEKFFVDMDKYGNDRKSLSAARKFIDDHIKENTHFTPFWVEKLGASGFTDDEKIKITGIRKDGKFVFVDEDGANKSISEYNEGDWFLVVSDNDKYREELRKLNKQLDEIREKIVDVTNKFVKTTLKQLKHKYIRDEQ